MTEKEILSQIVNVVLPRLVERFKTVEQQLEYDRKVIQNLSTAYAEMKDKAGILTAPKPRKPRKKKSEDPVVTEEEIAQVEEQLAATPEPLDATPDELGYFDALVKQGIVDVDLAANAYGVDRAKFGQYLDSLK